MVEEINFASFLFDKELTKFPSGVAEYFRFSKTLDISRLLDVDMIPSGLKGVEAVQIRHRNEKDFPRFIAPDFRGEVGYNTSDGEWCLMPKDLILKAKMNYIKYREKIEAARHPEGGLYPLCVLPTNMSFFEKNGQVYLDLSQTTIKEKPFVFGVHDIIMPVQKKHSCHQHKRLLSLPKTKTYE